MFRLVQPRPVLTRLFKPRLFSITASRLFDGEVDPDLIYQLGKELKFEKENLETPKFVKEFLENSSFKIQDKLGHDKVTLTRIFGTEQIKVVFSISDINNIIQEYTEVEEEEEEEEKVSFPVRATVTINKEGKGDLILKTLVQDNELFIDNVRHVKEGEEDKELYDGPIFDELDEELKITFIKYLEERGIDTALATFLPDYVDYKEQKEYIDWLKRVQEFLS